MALERFYKDATTGKEDETIVKDPAVGFYISNRVIFGASAIMKSFGTGSAMDKTSRYLEDYWKSGLVNRLRQGYAVVGREQGIYTDIYGNPRYSEGAFAGTSIEGTFYYPTQPTYTIQNAEKWLEQKNGWLEQSIKSGIEQWFKTEWNKFWEYR